MADIERDHLTAKLSDRRRAILAYAGKLNQTPGDICREDLELLREQDLSDTDILHLAELVGYYAYANRIASGLGVQLEEDSED